MDRAELTTPARKPLRIVAESLVSCRAEAAALALAHFAEVEGGVEPKRPHCPDWEAMEKVEAAGALIVYTARREGRLVGYLTWQISPDLESKGLLVGFQGAWYVAPKAPMVAWKLFQASLRDLRSRGVKLVFPHHRTQGRGQALGRFFARLGAKHIQQTYSLWIGD